MRTRYDDMLAAGSSPADIAAAIRADAERASGPARYLALRAPAYLDLFRASNGNFAFALVAAHGAVWASWYVPLAGWIVQVLAAFAPGGTEKTAAYARYVDAFREINRRVAAETYAAFYLTRTLPEDPLGGGAYPPALRDGFAAAHRAAARGETLPPSERRAFYEAYFRWEQTGVVEPMVEDAVAAFTQWPLVRWFCMRPWVWFSYFPAGRALRFRRFADAEERVRHGLTAHDLAARAGWDRAERALTAHPFYPRGRWCHVRDGLFGRRPGAGDLSGPANETDRDATPSLSYAG